MNRKNIFLIFSDYMAEKLGLSYSLQYKIAVNIILLLLTFLIWKILRRQIEKRFKGTKKHYYLVKTADWGSLILGILILGIFWNEAVEAFVRFFDLLGNYLQSKIVLSLLIIALILILRRVLMKIISDRITDIKKHYYWSRTIGYGTTILGILIIGSVWIKGIQSIATFIGLVSAGLAVALHDPISNFAGWLFIIWRQPFRVGDRIQISEFQGDVIDIRMFQFTILEIGNWVDSDQSTGRIIDIPNGKILREGLANYTKGFEYIWHEIPVLITFESNWKKAKEILIKIANEKVEHLTPDATRQLQSAARKYMILYHHLTPIVYTTVKESGVLLTIRFMTKPRQRRGTNEIVWEALLDAFKKEPDIELAYPTTRFYNTRTEKNITQKDINPDIL
jgi:small-conductance mechanosensitive channel